MKHGDFILIAALVLLSLLALFLLPREDGATAVVRTPDGKYCLPLDVDTELVVESALGRNVIVIKDGTARIAEADCPDASCIHMGVISRRGETVVCLPHQVSISIEDAHEGVDAIVR